MNKVEILIKTLEKEMKAKKIKKSDLYGMFNPNTVAGIFNQFKGNLSTLKEIADFIESYIPEEEETKK